jgi:hypothetical protein
VMGRKQVQWKGKMFLRPWNTRIIWERQLAMFKITEELGSHNKGIV